MKVFTDERCMDYSAVGHLERPARIGATLRRLRSQDELPIQWERPAAIHPEDLLLAHDREYLDRVRDAERDFDADTPAYPDILEHARRSVAGALGAMDRGLNGETAFSLLRPPGHHATRNRAMGFCYLNSIALASLTAAKRFGRRVAVFDFDVHHGNGTEAILMHQPNVAYVSVHQHPCYPGSGTADVGENCFNFPVPPRTPREVYREVCRRALDRLEAFRPELIGVSAGFDAYRRDPLAQETLEAEDFHWLGSEIRGLAGSCFSVLEGGYSTDLPELILAFLTGMENR